MSRKRKPEIRWIDRVSWYLLIVWQVLTHHPWSLSAASSDLALGDNPLDYLDFEHVRAAGMGCAMGTQSASKSCHWSVFVYWLIRQLHMLLVVQWSKPNCSSGVVEEFASVVERNRSPLAHSHAAYRSSLYVGWKMLKVCMRQESVFLQVQRSWFSQCLTLLNQIQKRKENTHFARHIFLDSWQQHTCQRYG